MKYPTIVTRRAVADRLRPHDLMAMTLNTARIQEFESHIKNSYEGVVFDVMITHDRFVGNAIELTWIIVQDRKQGVGTAIMRELCDFADRHAAEIRLKTASKGDYAATTSRARLIRFYKRFGFVTEKREPGEITGGSALMRRPVV